MENVLIISRELAPFTFGGFARLLHEYLKRVTLFEYRVLTWYNRNRKDEGIIRFIQIKQPPFFHDMRYFRASWFILAGFLKCCKQGFDAVIGTGFNGSLLAVPLGLIKKIKLPGRSCRTAPSEN